MQSFKVYCIQVSGISCTNCAAKIVSTLSAIPHVKKVSVNVMQEKVNVTIDDEQSKVLELVAEALKSIKKPQIANPILLSGGAELARKLGFVYQDISRQNIDEILKKVSQLPGIENVNEQVIKVDPEQNQNELELQNRTNTKISVSYNCEIIKGRQISDLVETVSPAFKASNERIDSFRNQTKIKISKRELYETLALIFYFMFFNMVLPATGGWYEKIMCFPYQFGIYSCFMVINIIVTVYTLRKFGIIFLKNAVNNYMDDHTMNMETLVALGSTASFSLFLFFIVKYTIAISEGQLKNNMKAIMELCDSLTSSALIVVIVSLGKYLEKKVKIKIQRMANQIFPQSQLFSQTIVKAVEIKNRNLVINKEKDYDVTAIQKNDIVRLLLGRLLLDVVLISGKTIAVESILTGNDDPREFGPGDRLRSGSMIVSSDSLAQVQNNFQRSALVEIGAQIKMSNNTDEAQQSGVQSLCRTISNHFVKGVITISIIVALAWTYLLSFEIVTVHEVCKVCYVVERAVGVLVASCPCALGLAVPSVLAISLNLAIKNGILLRKNKIYEKIKNCNVVAFDKTGTLFTKVEKIEERHVFMTKFDEKQLWQIVAVVEKTFKHPLAEVLYKQGVNRSQVKGTNFRFVPITNPVLDKEGIVAEIKNKPTSQTLRIRLGNKNLMTGIMIPQSETVNEGATKIYLSINQQIHMLAVLNTHSNLRPEAKEVIKELQSLGKQVHILSGDSKESVSKISQQFGIPETNQHAEHSAAMKVNWIRQMQSDGTVSVMMIGDGLNDIPCLQQASIGVSINAKSELNLNAASIILLNESLKRIVIIFKLLRMSNIFINMNLLWAFAYNIVMLPIMAGVFYNLHHMVMSPVWSAISMSLSSLVVVIFSQFLMCFDFESTTIATNSKESKTEIMLGTASEKMKYQTFEEEV